MRATTLPAVMRLIPADAGSTVSAFSPTFGVGAHPR